MLFAAQMHVRHAAAGWQHLVRNVSADIGSSNCPCAFAHASRDLDMVVHGDDFIIAGPADDFDWLSQKLNEKLVIVQRTRLGPAYFSEATVFNRCVSYSDSGWTWEADARRAELAVAGLGLQSARPRTGPGGAKLNAPLDHEELEPDRQKAYQRCQQDWRTWHLTDPTLHSIAKNAAAQSGKRRVTRLGCIGRYLLHALRVAWMVFVVR